MDSFRRLILPGFFGSGSMAADILVAGPLITLRVSY